MGYTQRGLDRAAGRLRRVADGTRNHCASVRGRLFGDGRAVRIPL